METEKVTKVWSCEKGNGGRSVDISGRNKSIREKESRKTWKEFVKRDLELIAVDDSMVLDRGRWRKIIASLTPT